MAIYHSTTKIIGRTSGRSPVSAAAYRAGQCLYNERDGLTHDYTLRDDILYSDILLPAYAPPEYQDRYTLWNAVEFSEKRKDAQTAREIELALPNELTHTEHVDLLNNYVRDNFVNNGMIADFSIHSGHKHNKRDKDDILSIHDKDIKPDNPHAHIMLTMRPFNEDGTWGAKSTTEYTIGKNGKRKSRKIDTTDWNKRETLMKWRGDWADRCNSEFERKGLDERIDHRTYAEQGKDQEPTKHIGVTASAMEKKGIPTERGDENRKIAERNRKREVSRLLELEKERKLEEKRRHSYEQGQEKDKEIERPTVERWANRDRQPDSPYTPDTQERSQAPPPEISKSTGEPVKSFDEWKKEQNKSQDKSREKGLDIDF